MQVANASNNIIRILFNPKIEAFGLFDILLVKSDEHRYLAQVTEIFSDKFDASQNVAKLKLFYTLNENNEVMPYDNFTPNKECEVVKINQKQIENFINEQKPTFALGVGVKNNVPFEIQEEFFSNQPIILADKVQDAFNMSISIAKKLQNFKNTVIVDFTGVLNFDGAKIIKAKKDFKLPLNVQTIDFVFDKFLSDASLEFQALGNDIVKEIKKFIKAQKSGYIPFKVFINVLKAQLKATPNPELKVLVSRLQRCQLEGIFADSVKSKDSLFETIKNNPLTIVDLSVLENCFQKQFFENFINEINQDIYLLVRINDDNSDIDLINKIYNKKPNIKFIPNASYNYKRLPYLVENCKNYILLPSLYQRTDCIEAYSLLSNLILDECIVFGKDTQNFIYLIKDYSIDSNTNKPNYRKIALSYTDTPAQNVELKVKQDTRSSRLLEELEPVNIQVSNKGSVEIEDPKETFDKDVEETYEEYTKDIEQSKEEPYQEEEYFEEGNENYKEEISFKDNKDDTEIIPEEENNIIVEETKEVEDDGTFTSDLKEIAKDEFANDVTLDAQNVMLEPAKKEIEHAKSDTQNIIEEAIENQEVFEEKEPIEEIEKSQEVQENEAIQENEKEPLKEISFKEALEIKSDENEEVQNEIVEQKQELPEQEVEQETNLSEEELDFFEIAKESSKNLETSDEIQNPPEENEQQQNEDVEENLKEDLENNLKQVEIQNDLQNPSETVMVDDVEYKLQNDNLSLELEEDIDLSSVANNSINDSFEQLINESQDKGALELEIDENTKLDENILLKDNGDNKEDDLPIFKEEIKSANEEENQENYEVGSIIRHKKYGVGKVTKTIKYDKRQLLQIEFENSGKKLLDPVVADIKLEQ